MTAHLEIGAAFLLGLAACAHAGAPERQPLLEVVWPKPPQEPRVRLVAVFPPPGGVRPRPSPLRRAWEIFSGVESLPRAETLVRPFGVAAGTANRFFVSDPEGAAVRRVDEDGSSEIQCKGISWTAPMGLAAASDGALLVADAGLPGVVRIGADGACSLLAPGAFERPVGVATSGDRTYVVDALRHELVTLAADGTVAERRGGRGGGDGQLHFPTAVAITASGAVLVTDSLNGRVVRWDPDGRWATPFGGSDAAPLIRPKGIASGPDDRIYVADGERDEVVVFDRAGAREYAIGVTGTEPGQFEQPAGVAVAANHLLVADSLNGRVQVFEILGGRP